MGLAQTWLREGTGGIIIDVPVDTPNARAAADSLREIQATFAAAGVPPRGIAVRQYRPEDPRHMAAIRLNYPKISAIAGPCGLWPEDLGPSINNKGYFDNKPVLQFRLRQPAQPRGDGRQSGRPRAAARETPPYTPRRNIAFDKYRKGTPTATTYPESDQAKLSDTGK